MDSQIEHYCFNLTDDQAKEIRVVISRFYEGRVNQDTEKTFYEFLALTKHWPKNMLIYASYYFGVYYGIDYAVNNAEKYNMIVPNIK